MSRSPYRETPPGRAAADRLVFPTPRKMSALGSAYLLIVAIPVALGSMAIGKSVAVAVLTYVAVVGGVRLLRSLRMAGTTLEVAERTLILRNEWRRSRASVPLADVVRVKIETAEVAALDTGVRAGPGFGMPQRGGGVRFESRIALVLRDRAEPVYLQAPRSRQSMTETTEEYGRVVRFLRSQGWAPADTAAVA